ncbi:MAG: M16 family metallopeptidase [Planctomycetota bacterium]
MGACSASGGGSEGPSRPALPPAPAPSSAAVSWTVHTLDNGLRIVVEEVHSSPAVAISLNVLTGSAGERPHEYAGAHFLEHMLYMGTPTRERGGIRNEMHDRGAQTGALTDYDRIEYWVTCQPDDFEQAIDGLSDGFHNMLLTKERVEKERTVIIDELEQRLDNNFTFALEECARLTFQPHPYARRKGGELPEARKLTLSDLESIRRDFYRPDNLVFIVSGDIGTAHAVDTIAKHFGADARPATPKAEPAAQPPARGFEHRFIERDAAQTYVVVGAPMPSMVHPDQAAVDMLIQFLHARIYTQLVVADKIASRVDIGVVNHRRLGFFHCTATAADHRLAGRVERVMLEQIHRLTRIPTPTAELNGWDEYAELAKFQRQFRMDHLFNQQDARARAGGLAWGAVEGTLDHWANYLERIDGVTLDDLGRTARIYFDKANLNTVIVGPAAARLTPEDEQARETALAALDFGKAPPDYDAVAPTSVATGWVETGLENGVRVLTKTSTDFPLVSFGIFTRGGAAEDPIGLEGRANLANTMLTLGAGESRRIDGTTQAAMDRAAFSTLIYGFGNNFEKSTGRAASQHVLTVARSDLEKALNMMSAAYLHPTYPEHELQAELEQQRGHVRAAADDLQSTAIRHARRLIYGERHPYAQEIYGNAASLRLLRREDLLDAYAEGLDPRRAVITFVGDITPREATTLARKAFGAWTPLARGGDAAPMQGVVPEFDRPAGGRHEFHMDKEQAFVVMGCQAVAYDDERYPAASMLAKVGAVRAFKELIYERKVGYSASVWLDSSMHGGGLFLYVHCQAEKVDAAIAELQALAEALATQPIPAEELAKAKANVIGGTRLSMQRAAAVARSAGGNAVVGLPPDHTERYLAAIAKLTPKQIRESAGGWLDPAALTLVIVRRDPNHVPKDRKSK